MQGGAAKGRNYGLSKLHSAKVTKKGRVFCVYFSLGLKEKNKNVTVFVTGLCYNTTMTKTAPVTARTENAYRRRKYRTEKSKPRESVGRKARRLKRGDLRHAGSAACVARETGALFEGKRSRRPRGRQAFCFSRGEQPWEGPDRQKKIPCGS